MIRKVKSKKIVLLMKEVFDSTRVNIVKAREKIISSYSASILFSLSLLYLIFAGLVYVSFSMGDTLKVTFLDVGQGDGILIESGPGTKVLIDGGPSPKVISKIARLLPIFDTKIDLVAPTHADKDHVLGSIEVLHSFSVVRSAALHASSTTSLDEEYSRGEKGTEVFSLLAGDRIDIGGGAFLTVLLPRAGERFSEKETNESSQVMLLTQGYFSFLLTGDLPLEREHLLIESGLLPRHLTVLKSGHHGSKGSTGAELLSYTHPDYVVMSVGKDNKYGHPSKDTLERVEKVGSKVLRTDTVGNVSFEVDAHGVTVTTEK